MLGYSKIQIMGNLGGDPETRALPSGDHVTNFSVAVNRRYKDREGKRVEKTEWYRVCVFNQLLGEACAQNLRRGAGVFVEGDLRVRLYDSKDGKQVAVEIVPDTVRFLGSPPVETRPEPRAAPGNPDEALADETPF